MKQMSFVCESIPDLIKYLNSEKMHEYVQISESVLVQIFGRLITDDDVNFVKSINKTIKEKLPSAVVVGMSAFNSICDGETINFKNIISFTFFETTKLKHFSTRCNFGEEEAKGKEIGEIILNSFTKISGILLFSSIFQLRPDLLLESLTEKLGDIPIFGGAACKKYDMSKLPDAVYDDEDIFKSNVVAVVFSGKDLKIETHTYIGWEPLSKEMTITSIENGNIIKEIDGVSPLNMYKKYVDTAENELQFINALEFPIYTKKGGKPLLRAFNEYMDEGSVTTVGPFHEGDKIRIAYGDPELIIKNARMVHRKIAEFAPEAILIYSCAIRKVFMNDDIQLEVKPFKDIAPTAGVYTFGELCGVGSSTYWNEMSLVVVAMKENDNSTYAKDIATKFVDDVYEDVDVERLSQTTLISRLVHFTRAVVDDLEETNKKLEHLSITDSLTGLYNRGKIDEILRDEIDIMHNTGTNLSLILLDIDLFKLVNDTYGHHIGDIVLKGISNIIINNLRKTDDVGRWGGEEFLIVLRNTSLNEAKVIAERLKNAINQNKFEISGYISASFGVIEVSKDDDEIKALNRVDKALYEAKNTGRNKVVVL